VAVVLWVAMPIIGIFGFYWLIIQGLSVAGCEGDCREGFISFAYAGLPWAIGGSFVVAVTSAIVLAALRRRVVWAPLAGTVVLVGYLVAAQVALLIGFAPMWERNARIESAPTSLLSEHDL
jgi:hypothetical protein